MKRGWVLLTVAGAVLVVGSWWVNASFSPARAWACDTRTTAFDGWPARSTSLAELLATVDAPPGAVAHDPDVVSKGHVVQEYVADGELVKQVQATRVNGVWSVDSVSSC